MRDESSNGTGPTFADETTCEPFHSPETGESISSAAGSPVSQSVQPDCDSAKLMNGGSGQSLHGCFAYFDHATHSWKTRQGCLLADLEPFSVTWPRSGTMRNGLCFPRAPWVHHIHERGCSFLPTPTASWGPKGYGFNINKIGRNRYRKDTIMLARELANGWRPSADMVEAFQGFPEKWTDCDVSAILLSPRSPNGSDDESSKAR